MTSSGQPWVFKLSPQVEETIAAIADKEGRTRSEVLDMMIGAIKADLVRSGRDVTDIIIEPADISEG